MPPDELKPDQPADAPESPPISRAALLVSQLTDLSSAAAQSVGLIPSQTQADKDRSWIARQIITVFVTAIVGVFGLLALQGFVSGHWDAPASQAVELIKTAVLPIVTLVLGYYFGSRDNKG